MNVHRISRAIALAVVIVGMISVMSRISPKISSLEEMERDAARHSVGMVYVRYSGSDTITASWSSGLLEDKSAEFPWHLSDSTETVAERIRSALGHDARTVVEEGDPLAGLGGLSSLVPVLYFRFIPLTWLKWMVVVACVVTLVTMSAAKPRRARKGHWLAAALLGGTGFVFYLWSEPDPLLCSRSRSEGGRNSRQYSGFTVFAGTAGMLGLCLVGCIVLRYRPW
ncbi:hypothetical protein [Streptomyces sp. NPDC093707]|uniref:hypothetical protein n=1 Tax=Streptomyces sp. NPDC093707 TaxID=3154984 RepID=UPI00344D7114